MKPYCAINCLKVRNLLVSDVGSTRSLTANYMKLSIGKTKVIYFSRKINILIYEYKLHKSSIAHTDPIEDLEIFLDCKLHFQPCQPYILLY
jgi:hypothetical protein